MRSKNAFTIVELLVVIIIIGILAVVSVVSYSSVVSRTAVAKRENDLTAYYKAIILARDNTGKYLQQITNNYWSAGSCLPSSGNPGNLEPKNLAKTHPCWTTYYDNLDKISIASGVPLNGLKSGDANGNPYILDENEFEVAGVCNRDQLYYFDGNGTASSTQARQIPLFRCT